jgi:YHS domain-containing protein
MDLDDQNAVASSDYQGKVYWFCAHTCKQAFEEDPERYLRDISSTHLKYGGGGATGPSRELFRTEPREDGHAFRCGL